MKNQNESDEIRDPNRGRVAITALGSQGGPDAIVQHLTSSYAVVVFNKRDCCIPECPPSFFWNQPTRPRYLHWVQVLGWDRVPHFLPCR
ncbi:Cytochrome P450 [Sesbania bispinosa]|nr:Cytochrome P450 [Sesbania bispinosa]